MKRKDLLCGPPVTFCFVFPQAYQARAGSRPVFVGGKRGSVKIPKKLYHPYSSYSDCRIVFGMLDACKFMCIEYVRMI